MMNLELSYGLGMGAAASIKPVSPSQVWSVNAEAS